MPLMNALRGKTKETGRGAQERRTEQAAPRAGKLRGRLPSKRTINLATVNIKRINWKVAVPLILLILAGAAALSKFAVLDRYTEVAAVQRDVAQLQSEVAAGYRRIESFGSLNERYAHYSYADMTQEEAERVDRVDVIRLLRRVVLPRIEVDMWSLNENVLTVTVRAGRLQDVNQLAQIMLDEDIVEYCTVRSAATIEERGSAATEEDDTQSEQVMAVLEALLVQPE